MALFSTPWPKTALSPQLRRPAGAPSACRRIQKRRFLFPPNAGDGDSMPVRCRRTGRQNRRRSAILGDGIRECCASTGHLCGAPARLRHQPVMVFAPAVEYGGGRPPTCWTNQRISTVIRRGIRAAPIRMGHAAGYGRLFHQHSCRPAF